MSGGDLTADMTLGQALTNVAAVHPRRVALTVAGRSTRFRELDQATTGLAAGLRRLGLRGGDPVLLLLPNGATAVWGFFATVRAGGVAVPLSPAIRPRELEAVVAGVRPAAIIAAPQALTSLETLRREEARPLPTTLVDGEAPVWARRLQDAAATDQAGWQAPPVALDQPAAIFHTTGTTGAPKAVVHTHRGLVASFLAMQQLYTSFFSGSMGETVRRTATLVWRYRARLRHGIGPQAWMTPLPWHGIAGFRVLLQALLGGHRLLLAERFQPRATVELVQRERVAIVALTPSMLEAILGVEDLRRHDLSSLLVVGLGAAPTSPELVRRARAALGCAVVVGYGATETAGGVLVTRMDDSDAHLAETVGRPFPGVEIRIMDERRQDLPAGAVGELACRVPGLMAGYHSDAGETGQVIDEQGWYFTGDLAVRDPDGYVRIVGRKRDVIIRGGQNVAPAELEGVLLEHPGVARAAVVGVPHRIAGEAIWAFAVPAPGAVLEPAELHAHCARHVEPHKVPDRFRVRPELPATSSGEVHRVALREIALAELHAAESGGAGG